MIVMVCPSGAQFPLTEEELRRLDGFAIDGTYQFVNAALRRRVTVPKGKALMDVHISFLMGAGYGRTRRAH